MKKDCKSRSKRNYKIVYLYRMKNTNERKTSYRGYKQKVNRKIRGFQKYKCCKY